MSQKNSTKEIIFMLDRFEGTKAVLVLEGQELVIPKRVLAKDVQEGDLVYAEFVSDQVLVKKRSDLARALLEEILQGD